MSDKNTQCKAIREALLSGRTLNPLESLREFGTMRLGARIFDIRRGRDGREPLEVDSIPLKTDNGKRVASYRLSKTVILEAGTGCATAVSRVAL